MEILYDINIDVKAIIYICTDINFRLLMATSRFGLLIKRLAMG